MKFVTAFLTMLMHGMMHDRRNFYERPSKKSRSRLPRGRGAPGNKLQKAFMNKMATKRGRRTIYDIGG